MSNCQLCGEPMPQGEEMFLYHGHSGPCPKEPLPKNEHRSRAEKLYGSLHGRMCTPQLEREDIEKIESTFAEVAAEARLAALEEASILAERLMEDGWFEIGPEIRALKESPCQD